MNFGMVAMIATVLAGPALLAFADGRMGPDQVGVRVLLAVVAAVVAEGLARRFVTAVRPLPVRQSTTSPETGAEGASQQRRADGA